jgi:hypothetical protein
MEKETGGGQDNPPSLSKESLGFVKLVGETREYNQMAKERHSGS